MIDGKTFTYENIKRIQNDYKVDPELAQRAILRWVLWKLLKKLGQISYLKVAQV